MTGASHARTYINNVLVDERTGNFKFGKVGMREDHGERDGHTGRLVYECSVPANTTATLRLPVDSEQTEVLESETKAETSVGVEYMGFHQGCKVYSLGSGSYRFTTSISTGIRQSASTTTEGQQTFYDLSGRPATALIQRLYVTEGKKVLTK